MARSCISLLWCHQMTIFQGSNTTQLLWKMLTSLKTSMQMNRSWLRGSPLSQSHGYFSPVFAVPFTPGWLQQLLVQQLPMEPSAILHEGQGQGLGTPQGKSQTLQHSRESSVSPVASQHLNKCFFAVALFVIQLLHALISPTWQQENMLSELHTFIVTCMHNSHRRNHAVIL